jgi:preprotein translocase subunit YajC
MRLLISFFLSLFIYLCLIFLFIYFILYNDKTKQVKQIYIHQAIIKYNQKQNISKVPKPKEVKKQEVKNTIKKSIKKTEDTFSKGGDDIKFDDIFANTPDNIPTKKIKYKKQENMTKKRGHSEFSKLVKKELSNLSSSVAVVSNSDKKSSDYISNEFGKVWAEINTQDGNFVTLRVDVVNHKLNVVVISTNLDTILLNKFLNKLKNIDMSKIKEFHGKITFNTKLKGS